MKLISTYYDDSLAGPFRLNKTCKLITQNYYLLTFCHNVETYVIGFNIDLASKVVKHKFYDNFQLPPVPTY